MRTNNNTANVQKIEVGPQLAARWLDKLSEKQRPVSKKIVGHYARIMDDGAWQLSNDMIVFDKHGQLVNGQHRLNAIIDSGITVPFYVARKMPEDSFLTMDVPARRRADHYLKDCGYRYTLSGAARFYVLWDKEDFPYGKQIKPTNQEMVNVAKNTQLMKSAKFINDRPGLKIICDRGFQAWIHWYYVNVGDQDESEVSTFFDRLATGADLKWGDPEMALRNRILMTDRRVSSRDKQACLIIALKAFLKGRSLVKVQWRKNRFPSL